jgi:multidrug efflux pump
MVVHMVSPDNRYDALYLRNYGTLNVRDQLLRIPGMGSVQTFGSGDYAMRIWLDPQKLAARNLTSNDVVAALREQNAQVAAGVVGSMPAPQGTEFQLSVNTQGRLATEEQFAEVIVKADTADSSVIRIKDVGRVEMGPNTYALGSLLNNKEAAALAIFQAPNSNALQLSSDVRATMERLKPDFPPGVDYDIVYDPTRFVQTSIEKVISTLAEAILLVVIVVVIFLQTWRASLIPLLAVPVSIVGTFAVLLLTGAALGDRFGRRRMFAAGIGLFVAASVACALAGNAASLVAARALQGAGAALVMPLAMATRCVSFFDPTSTI